MGKMEKEMETVGVILDYRVFIAAALVLRTEG